jgi:dTDP-4-amino-4,6-dideoxygalactose transaminase
MVFIPPKNVSHSNGRVVGSNLATMSLSLPQAPIESHLTVPFNKVLTSNLELEYIREAIASGRTSGDGQFTKLCKTWLEQQTGCESALITHSCTAALEMAAILADIQPGDEVIMPSYTFVSTANAFVLRGAVPVFIDIRPDTFNKAIADEYNLLIIEDAAQAISTQYKGKPVGSMGHMATFSFHETKNIVSGEGGALLINDPQLLERAEIIREKGTNRSKFFRGEVDKYTWVDIGSSYLPSDIIAAFLWAQLEQSDYILQRRLEVWNYYHEKFIELEALGLVRRPIVPDHCQQNGHIYSLLVKDLKTRTALMASLKSKGIQSTFHYVPLHSSPAGLKYGRTVGNLDVTNRVSECLVRLPLGSGMTHLEADYVSHAVIEFMTQTL